MTVRDGDELTIVYGKQLGKGKNELVLLEVEKNEITVVNIQKFAEDKAPVDISAGYNTNLQRFSLLTKHIGATIPKVLSSQTF